MSRMGLKLWVSSFLIFAVACDCGSSTPPSTQMVAQFVSPIDGQKLTSNDALPGGDGFRINVVVESKDTGGAEVAIGTASLQVRATAGGGDWTEISGAMVEGAKVTFPAVALPGAANNLRVTLTEADGTRTAQRTIVVFVGQPEGVPTITVPAEQAVLGASADADADAAGYQVHFEVTAPGLEGASGTLYCDKVCGLAPANFSVDATGKASLNLTLESAICEAEVAECYVSLSTSQGDPLTSAKRTFTLDTVAPAIEIISPPAAVTSTTFNVQAMVGCVEEGTTATLTPTAPGADGGAAPPLMAQVTGGMVTFSDVTVAGAGSHEFRLEVADPGLNLSTKTFTVEVALGTPTLTLNAAASVTADEDAVRPGVQAQVTVIANTEPVGRLVEVSLSAGTTLGQPRTSALSQVGPDRVASIMVDLAEGANQVRACVTNAAGVQACDSVVMTVATSRPSCEIVSPLDSSRRKAGESLLSVAVTGTGSGDVNLTAYDSTGSVATGAAALSGGSATVALTLPADGTFYLAATCPGGGVTQAVAVSLDTAPPTVATVIRGEQNGVIGDLVFDSSPSPGLQGIAEVTTEPFASVRITGCSLSPAGVSGKADLNGLAVVREVSLPASGSCTLTVKSTDLAGNETTAPEKTLSIAAAGGMLSFAAPSPGAVLTAADGVPRIGGGLTVTVSAALASLPVGATVKLFKGVTELSAQQVGAGDTSKSFENVELDEGPNFLRLVASSPGSASFCATAIVFVRTTMPTIAITSPADNTVFDLADDLNSQQPGMQQLLQYAAPGASAVAKVDLCSDVLVTSSVTPCRDGSGWFTVASSIAGTSPAFTFPDGSYRIKAVLDDGVLAVSDAVSVTVDGTRPQVIAVSLTQDGNSDGVLNLTEAPLDGDVQVQVTTQGAAGGSVHIRLASGGSDYGVGSVDSNGVATVALTALPGALEASYSLVVDVYDVVGNPNNVGVSTAGDPRDDEAFFSLGVDRQAPTLTVTSPTDLSLALSDDASADTGFQVRLVAAVSADVGANGVHITGPSGLQMFSPVSQTVTQDFTIASSGSYSFTLVAFDAGGNSSATVTLTLEIDFDPPTLAFVTPTSMTYPTSYIPVSLTAGGAEGRTVLVSAQPGAGPTVESMFTVTGGAASGTMTLPNGTYTFTATTTDPVGNGAVAVVSNVVVLSTGCDIALTDPSSASVVFNAANDASPSAGHQYTLVGTLGSSITQCRGKTVSLYKGAALQGSVSSDGMTGAFSFPITTTDGESATFRVEVVDTGASGLTTSDSVQVAVDISPPAFSAVTPAQSSIFLVADNNIHVRASEPGYLADKVQDGDAESDWSFSVSGGTGGTLRVLYRGTPLVADIALDADPKAVTLTNLTFPHNTNGTLELRATDSNGNVVSHLTTVVVDVLTPGATTLQASIPAGQTPPAERIGKVSASWTAAYDDGLDTLSGNPTSYDLRWNTTLAAPTGFDTTATYFDADKSTVAIGGLIPGNVTTGDVTGLTPMNSYHVQLRAVDEVGNYARTANQVALSNPWSTQVWTNPTQSTTFGQHIAAGDVNGDGFADLVTGSAVTVPGVAFVYYGSAGMTRQVQVLTIPEGLLLADGGTVMADGGTLTTQTFGEDVSIGNVGDFAAADGLSDLLVSGARFNGSQGRATLYFGRTGANPLTATGDVKFLGNAGNFEFSRASRIIPDLNGDGRSEIMINAHRENGGLGNVYLWYGRTAEAFQLLAQANGGVIPASTADKVFAGPPTLQAPTSNRFGYRRGYAVLGDLSNPPDGLPEFTIPDPAEPISSVFIYNGATVAAASNPIALSTAFQTLTQPSLVLNNNGLDGFGNRAIGNLQLNGTAGPDLVVTHQASSRIHLFLDGTASGFGAPVVVPGPGGFGSSLAVGDLNLDGKPDLAVGEVALPPTVGFILFHRNGTVPNSTSLYDDGITARNHQVRVSTPNSLLGSSAAIGDFNGDGYPDVAFSDTQQTGSISIWY